MNLIHRIRRCLAGLTRRVGVLLVCGAAVPGALATPRPEPPGWNKHPPLPPHVRAHPVVIGGMPGWQITLIAVAAALLMAALAVAVDRMWAARRRVGAGAA